MNYLLLDVGNSRLKWRVIDADPANHANTSGFLDHGYDQSVDGVLGALEHLWQPYRGLAIKAAFYSSVAGADLNLSLERLVMETFHHAPITRVQSKARLGPIENGYREPARLGVDRLLAMCGARGHVASGALLIATIGTATTIDLVNAANRFEGGAILPGPLLMARALHDGTAGLPMVDLQQADVAAFGLDTDEAMRSGILNATLGAIDRLRLFAEERHGQVTCVLSGGGGELAAQALSFPSQLFNNLVLDGLAMVARGELS